MMRLFDLVLILVFLATLVTDLCAYRPWNDDCLLTHDVIANGDNRSSFIPEVFSEQLEYAECLERYSNKVIIDGQSLYGFHIVSKTWHDARTDCHKRNGRLVSITDGPLLKRLSGVASQLANTENGVWLGLFSPVEQDVSVWDNYDTEFPHEAPFRAWASTKAPSQDRHLINGSCVYMSRRTGWRWDRASCHLNQFSYICEYRTPAVSVRTTSDPLISSNDGDTSLAASPTTATQEAATTVTATASMLNQSATSSVEAITAAMSFPSVGGTSFSIAALRSVFPSPAEDNADFSEDSGITLTLSTTATCIIATTIITVVVTLAYRRLQWSRQQKSIAVIEEKANNSCRQMVPSPTRDSVTPLEKIQYFVTIGENEKCFSQELHSKDVLQDCTSKNNSDDGGPVAECAIYEDIDSSYAELEKFEPGAAQTDNPAAAVHQYACIDFVNDSNVRQQTASRESVAAELFGIADTVRGLSPGQQHELRPAPLLQQNDYAQLVLECNIYETIHVLDDVQ